MFAAQPNDIPRHVPPENYKTVLIVGAPRSRQIVMWSFLKNGTTIPEVFHSLYLDVVLDDGKQVYLRLFEHPCKPEFFTAEALEFDDAKAILLCCDVTEDKSLTSLEKTWYPKFRQYNPIVPVFVVCLKRTDSDVLVLPEQTEAVAGKIRAVKYFMSTYANIHAVVWEMLKTLAETVSETQC